MSWIWCDISNYGSLMWPMSASCLFAVTICMPAKLDIWYWQSKAVDERDYVLASQEESSSLLMLSLQRFRVEERIRSTLQIWLRICLRLLGKLKRNIVTVTKKAVCSAEGEGTPLACAPNRFEVHTQSGIARVPILSDELVWCFSVSY